MDLLSMARVIAADLMTGECAVIIPASFIHCPKCNRLIVRDAMNPQGNCTRECRDSQNK